MLIDDREGRDELVGDLVVIELTDPGQRIGVGSSLRECR